MEEIIFTKDEIERLYKEIGLKVKKYREEAGLTQLELSLAIGHRAVGTVSMAELYINKKHFNIEHLHKISKVLCISISDLIPDNNT
jgi:DNA-binding XRE family transcriptional regulator